MGFLDKAKQAAKSAADKASEQISNANLDEKLSKTKENLSNNLNEIKEKNAEEKRLKEEAKAPVDGAIIRYQVVYLGGFPNKPQKKMDSKALGFNILKDRFVFKPELLAKREWFGDDNYEILYENVKKFEIVKRQVSTAEAMMSSNGDTKSLEQENNIEITHNENGKEIVTRVEMLTGVTVYGQAQKCREMMDLLRENDILRLLNKPESGAGAAGSSDDIPAQIAKLSQLKDQGILTEEEFNAKKADLLAKM